MSNSAHIGDHTLKTLSIGNFAVGFCSVKVPSGRCYRKVSVGTKSNVMADYQSHRRMALRHWAVSVSREVFLKSGVSFV